MISFGKYGALFGVASMLTPKAQPSDIRRKVREPSKPSGKNRDKVKAARKQRRKSR